MSVFNAKNIISVLIGKSVSRTATVQYTDPVAASYLVDGEILVLGENGAILTSAATVGTNRKIRLVQRSGNTLVYSPWIDGLNLVKFTGVDGTAATEQTTVIGYNGSTGNIDASSTDAAGLTIQYTFDESMWSEQGNLEYYEMPAASATSAGAMATYFAEAINYKALPPTVSAVTGEGPLVRAEILCDEAGAAVTTAGSATTWAVTKGSDIVVPNGTLGAVNFAVGDYLRFDDAGSPATTHPVYRIKAIDTTNNRIQLGMKYQGTSTATLAEATDIVFITAAAYAAADCGIKITGQALKFTIDFFKYLQCTFRVGLKNFGTTGNVTTAAVRPQGSYEQVAELESFANGFGGALNRTIVPLPTGKRDAVSGTTYDVISLVWYDNSDVAAVSGSVESMQQLYICVVDGAAQTTAGTNGILTVLNAWAATCPGTFGTVSV
jgi:hypothetical protein